MDWDDLVEMLEASVKKNGEQPLTNNWLLNIIKLTQEKAEQEEYTSDMYTPFD